MAPSTTHKRIPRTQNYHIHLDRSLYDIADRGHGPNTECLFSWRVENGRRRAVAGAPWANALHKDLPNLT